MISIFLSYNLYALYSKRAICMEKSNVCLKNIATSQAVQTVQHFFNSLNNIFINKKQWLNDERILQGYQVKK